MTNRIEEEVPKITCACCGRQYTLAWESWGQAPVTVFILSCVSGGIYEVYLQCPHCNYRIEL